MFFYLTTLNLSPYLEEKALVITDMNDVYTVYVVDARKHSDNICQNYMLNSLVDTLYNVYCSNTTSKELCDLLNICINRRCWSDCWTLSPL